MEFDGVRAVDDVSLTVDEGEFVTLLGPSGCGKTTLLKLISGFLQPTAGQIEIGGKSMNGVLPENRDTAMCFQSYALFPHLSVTENLVFGLRQKNVETTERQQRLDEVTTQIDLGEHLHKLPNQLSGGQQQRVALGRALAVRPYVILFDEPLSNLDAKLREQVRFEVRAIQKKFGLTAIYVTHDQAEALAMSDRIFIMNKGRLEQSGSPDEIYHHPKTPFVADFVGSANVLDAETVGEFQTGLWQIRTPVGVLVSSSPPIEGSRSISWRPEVAVLDHPADSPAGRDDAQDGASGHNLIEARVLHRSFQGAFTDLLVEIGPVTQRLQLRRSDARDGDTVRFRIPVDEIVSLENRG